MFDYDNVSKWFAAELRERMEECGFRPYHLTSLCKMGEGEIYQCLGGTALPDVFSLILLADYLDCTVNDLLGYDEVESSAAYEQYTASDMFFTESQYAACLSDRVRRYLQDRAMSITDLAAKTGFKEPTLRRWFAKTHPQLPGISKFLKICEALDCTPSDLLGY